MLKQTRIITNFTKPFIFTILFATLACNQTKAGDENVNILDPKVFNLAAHKYDDFLKGKNINTLKTDRRLLSDYTLYSISSYLSIMLIAEYQGQIQLDEICIKSADLADPKAVLKGVTNFSIAFEKMLKQPAQDPQLIVFTTASALHPCK